MFTLASAPRPSSALSYGPSFLQEPPPTVLYSNNTGLVLGSVFFGQIIVFIIFSKINASANHFWKEEKDNWGYADMSLTDRLL